jgi:hypothetical protein
MKTIRLSCLILAVLLLSACRKKTVTVYVVGDNTKYAFNFKVGTYWVYTDSLSGAVDSFFVTSNADATDKYLDNNGSGYTMESITMNVSEKSLGSNTVTQYWKYIYQGNTINVFDSGAGIQTTEYVPLVNFPFESTISSSSTAPHSLLPSYADSGTVNASLYEYVIHSRTFYDDALITHSVKTATRWYTDTFILSPSFGIIKMMLHHPGDHLNRVWVLQDWNIVK